LDCCEAGLDCCEAGLSTYGTCLDTYGTCLNTPEACLNTPETLAANGSFPSIIVAITTFDLLYLMGNLGAILTWRLLGLR